MNKAQKKFLAGSVIIVLSIAFLIIKGINASSHYYYTVSEVLAMGPKARNIALRLEGKVAPGGIDKDSANLKLSFNMVDKSEKTIAVDYEGTIPDMFQEDISVVVEGTMGDDGRIKATKVLTSCPSRYDAAKEMKESS